MAAVAKYHKLGGLDNRILFPASLRGQKSKTKVWAGLVPSEGSVGWWGLPHAPLPGSGFAGDPRPSVAPGNIPPVSASVFS